MALVQVPLSGTSPSDILDCSVPLFSTLEIDFFSMGCLPNPITVEVEIRPTIRIKNIRQIDSEPGRLCSPSKRAR